MVGLGDPVFGDWFVNREKELELLKRRLESFVNEGQRRNIAIIGLRKIGKSSLIQEFINRNQAIKDCVFVYIYLPEGDQDAFFGKSVGAVLINAMKKNGYETTTATTVEQALSTIGKHYPKTVNFTYALIKKQEKEKSASLKDLLAFFDIFQSESKLHLAIIFDEFQRILDYGFPSPIDAFREFAMSKNMLWFVISGSSVGMLNQIVSSSESPLYGHFEQMPIKEFDFQNSSELVKKRLLPFSMGQLELGFIFELTNGNPYYLDLVAFRIKDKARELNAQSISQDTIIKALSFELFSAGGSIYAHLTSFIENSLEKRGFGSYIEILKSITNGATRLSQISQSTGIAMTSLPRYIKKLMEIDIIRKIEANDERYPAYYFIDPVLDLWLKEVFILREDSFTADLNAKRMAFENRIGSILSNYKSEIGKGNEARVRELFGLFDGSDILHGQKIPKFESVTNYTAGAEEIDVFAKEGNNAWLAEVTGENITIKNITDFIQKAKKTQIQNPKMAFIALNGIEEKVFEYCKKNKIALWNKNDINTLLKKYNKKRILF